MPCLPTAPSPTARPTCACYFRLTTEAAGVDEIWCAWNDALSWCVGAGPEVDGKVRMLAMAMRLSPRRPA